MKTIDPECCLKKITEISGWENVEEVNPTFPGNGLPECEKEHPITYNIKDGKAVDIRPADRSN